MNMYDVIEVFFATIDSCEMLYKLLIQDWRQCTSGKNYELAFKMPRLECLVSKHDQGSSCLWA